MEKYHIKKISGFLCLIFCVMLCGPLLFACSAKLTYSGGELSSGRVGAEYFAYVGTATGSENITYALKDGSVLPTGLLLDYEGFISGTPRSKTETPVSFIVTAASEEGATAESEFMISVSEGALEYKGRDLRVAAGQEFETTVAYASGASGAVTYKSKDLPSGVELSDDGAITGILPATGKYSFTVSASARDCAGAEAEFILNCENPWLEYGRVALPAARAGIYYTGSVASATGTDPNLITYALNEESNLPRGLKLDASGIIYGIPDEVGSASFTVVASAPGLTQAGTLFSMQIRPLTAGEVKEGTITFNDKELPEAFVGERYNQIGAISATTTNRQTVSFVLKSGSLPTGLSLLLNGTIMGTSSGGGGEFIVTASAPGCPDVDKQFKLGSESPRLTYSARTLSEIYVGETCSFSVASARPPQTYTGPEPVISYAMVGSLPAGLTLSPDGTVSGTPEKSAKTARFTVRASANGFVSADRTFSVHIEAAIVSGITRFEAEYLDLRGKSGGGYSGAASEEAMIQSFAGASNGYYLGWTHYSDLELTFEIISDRAVSNASLVLGLDSEIQTIILNPSVFMIEINGIQVSYTSFQLPGSDGREVSKFSPYTVVSGIALKAGKNTITLTVLPNTLQDGQTGGPMIDYMELGSLGGATLSWRPALYNLGR